MKGHSKRGWKRRVRRGELFTTSRRFENRVETYPSLPFLWHPSLARPPIQLFLPCFGLAGQCDFAILARFLDFEVKKPVITEQEEERGVGVRISSFSIKFTI